MLFIILYREFWSTARIQSAWGQQFFRNTWFLNNFFHARLEFCMILSFANFDNSCLIVDGYEKQSLL